MIYLHVLHLLKHANVFLEAAKKMEPDHNKIVDEADGGYKIHGIYVPPAQIKSEVFHTSRLIINYIVVDNFKSFKGKHKVGPFDQNFTCVIGSNGSGKSNLADSLLFVLGCHIDSLRSEKCSALIHRSGQEQARSCSVEVYFHAIKSLPGGKYEIIPGTELVIGRTASIKNSSYYTINKKEVEYKEVVYQLRSQGIDLNNHRFLLLQGEIEQIAMMGPRGESKKDVGFLEYIENISSSNRYKQSLQDFENKLESLRLEQQNLIKSLAHSKDALLAAKPKMLLAARYCMLENARIEITNIVLQKQIFNAKIPQGKTLEELDICNKNIKDLENQCQEIKVICEQTENDIDKLLRERDEVIRQREQAEQEQNMIENNVNRLEQEIISVEKSINVKSKILDEEERKVENFKKMRTENEATIQSLKASQEIIITKLETLREETKKETKHKTEELKERMDVLVNLLNELNEKTKPNLQQLNLAQTKLDLYERSSKEEEEKLNTMQNSLKNSLENLKQKQRLLGESNKKLVLNQGLQRQKEIEMATVKVNLEVKRTDLNQNQARLAEVSSAINKAGSRDKVLKFINLEKVKGSLPGVVGRLGDLAGIDAKYDCAISTACPQLDYIVVDTVSTAKNCLSKLKSTGIGRANFLALDQLSHWKERCEMPIRTPENIPRLFDILKIENEQLKCAFYFALRDTLVANNLEQAKRCSYGTQRFRVVTLNGEVIEISGTMSGGGNYKITGKMGQSANTAAIEEGECIHLQQVIDEQKIELNQLSNTVLELEKFLEKIKQEIINVERFISRFVDDIKGLEEMKEAYEKNINDQKIVVASKALNPDKLKELQTAIKNTQEKIDSIESEHDKVAMETEVKNITLSLKRLNEERKGPYEKELSNISKQIAKLTTSIKFAEKNEKISSEKIVLIKNVIEQLQQKSRDSSSDKESLSSDSEKISNSFKITEEKLTQLETKVKKLKSKIVAMEAVATERKIGLINAKNDRQILTKQLKKHDNDIKKIKNKLGALKYHPTVNYYETELPEYSDEMLAIIDLNKVLFKELTAIEIASESKADLKAVDEYRALEEKCNKLRSKVKIISEKIKSVKHVYGHIKTQYELDLRTELLRINYNLEEAYQMLSSSKGVHGSATLEFVDSLDLSAGIELSVRPPYKCWTKVSCLSGGEKTLVSLAFVFALHKYKPSPVYIMDEIDAALDYRNALISALYIRDKMKNTQFIVVSQREYMFEKAHRLLGVYKTYDSSKFLVINTSQKKIDAA